MSRGAAESIEETVLQRMFVSCNYEKGVCLGRAHAFPFTGVGNKYNIEISKYHTNVEENYGLFN